MAVKYKLPVVPRPTLLRPSFSRVGYKCPASSLRTFQIEQRMAFYEVLGVDYLGLSDAETWDKLNEDNHKYDQVADYGTMVHSVLQASVETKAKHPMIEMMVDIGLPPEYCDDEYIVNTLIQHRDYLLDQFSQASRLYMEVWCQINGVNSGGKVDYAWIADVNLLVRDLKTGRLDVQAENNSQLMTYGVTMMDKLKWPKKIKNINLGIMGLRWASSNWDISKKDLFEYKHDVIIPAYFEAHRVNPVAVTGDHCMHCTAKVHCLEYHDFMGESLRNMEVATEGFEEIETDDLEQLAIEAKIADKFFGDAKVELMKRYQAFDEPKQFKIQRGRKSTKWKKGDDDIVKRLKSKVSNEDELYDRVLKSPAQLKKLVGDDSMVDELVKISTGKPFLKL